MLSKKTQAEENVTGDQREPPTKLMNINKPDFMMVIHKWRRNDTGNLTVVTVTMRNILIH